MKDFLIKALVAVAFAAAFLWMLWYGTSAEVWYAGEHDGQCEMTDNCGCYERLVSGEVGK